MDAEINQIEKNKILEVLGKGTMGVVYKAFDPTIERYVALKIIADTNDSELMEEIRIRFKREAQAAGNLNHPNVVSIHEYGGEDRMPFIVMEYIPGQTLAQRIKQGAPLTVKQAVHIATEILSALSHAHANGVTHRDIKPGNILLAESGSSYGLNFRGMNCLGELYYYNFNNAIQSHDG